MGDSGGRAGVPGEDAERVMRADIEWKGKRKFCCNMRSYIHGGYTWLSNTDHARVICEHRDSVWQCKSMRNGNRRTAAW